MAENLPGAVADLSAAAARLRARVPLRSPSLCLTRLALAEYRLGSWDDPVVHAELAVSLGRDADRAWELGFVHFAAAVVPALRGEWEAAGAHAEMAAQGARVTGTPRAIGAAATAGGLRVAGQPQQAAARLRSARQRLITLGARPYLEICDRELAAAGAPAGPDTAPTRRA
jgi:hypothetical protein